MTELLYFSATWCGPCKAQWPTTQRLAEELDMDIEKIDIGGGDRQRDTAMKYGIQSIPTLVVLQDGSEVARHVGMVSKERLAEALANYK
jgi:thioredoxin 1